MRKLSLLSCLSFCLFFLMMPASKPASLPFKQSNYQPATMWIHPTFRQVGTVQSLMRPMSPGDTLFPCQEERNPQPALCYGPKQMQQAYGFNTLYQRQLTGKGTTIVVVVAYGSPSLTRDYAFFNQTWKLPNAPLKISTPFGVASTNSQWAFETTLDTQWAHALAPEATIHVVVARSNEDHDINLALQYAVDHNLGDVISLSFGELESCLQSVELQKQHEIFQRANQKGMTVLASSGDSGAGLPGCSNNQLVKGVSSPASDPLVTAIGGTRLYANPQSGLYDHEEVWQERERGSASGGGYSRLYKRPAYQEQVVTDTGRGVPDLAFNASTTGGVTVFYSSPEGNGQPSLFIAGGTSASAPEIAGFLALAVQAGHQRLGNINTTLYRLGQSEQTSQVYHDVLDGDNSVENPQIEGFQAGTGWDAVTGWGSPRTDKLLDFLLKKA